MSVKNTCRGTYNLASFRICIGDGKSSGSKTTDLLDGLACLGDDANVAVLIYDRSFALKSISKLL